MKKGKGILKVIVVMCALLCLWTGCGYVAATDVAVGEPAGKESTEILADVIEEGRGLRTDLEALETAAGSVAKSSYEREGASGLVYRFPNGDLYYQEAASAAAEGGSFTVKSSACLLRYYDMAQREWVTEDLGETTGAWWDCKNVDVPPYMTFLSFDTYEMILCPPMAYRQGESGTLRWQEKGDGAVSVSRISGEEWQVSVDWPASRAGEEATLYWWMLLSEAELIDWENPVMEHIWSGYQFTGETRWCGNGCYNAAPKAYTPGGGDYYFRNPASYTPARFIMTGGSRAADDLGVAMLDIIRGNYNEAGFIPMTVQCDWMKKDYDIGAGYFDTRWNTDVAEAYLKAGRQFGIPAFTDTAMKYAAFLSGHAQRNGFVLEGCNENQLLVSDYSDSRGNGLNYASLNHQLAELLFLYHTGEQEYMELARRMLDGVKSVGAGWIKGDGNLQYAVLPDGGYTGQDYPYLTYNDLYAAQEWLQGYYGQRDPVLDDLMAAKRGWMDRNGVSGYRK